MDHYYIANLSVKAFKVIGDQWLKLELSKGLNAIVGTTIKYTSCIYTILENLAIY